LRCVFLPSGAASFSRGVRPFLKRIFVVALGAAGLLLGGCEKACEGEALKDEEGKDCACFGPTDCLRSGNGVLCTSTKERLRDCVDCIDNVCTLFKKDACG